MPRIHLNRTLLPLALFTAFACAFQTLASADYWFHLRAGQSVAQGHIPRVDQYSFPSAGRPYIDLHWLYQLLAYGIHRLGGVPLAIWLHSLVAVSVFWILYRLAQREASSTVAALTTALGAVVASERFLVRPETLTFLFLAIALWLVRRHAEGWRPAWALFPLLIAIWVNVEGLFLLGFVVLGAAILDRPRDRRLWMALGAALGATLVNPYFLRGALHPLILYTRINGSIQVYSSSIGEFLGPLDPTFVHPSTILFPWLLGLSGLALLLSRRPRLSEIVLLAAFTFLAFRARRNLALLAIVAVPILARWLSLTGERLREFGRGRGWWRRRSRLAGAALAALLAFGFLAYDASLITGRVYTAIGSDHSFGDSEGRALFPWETAEFLSRNAIQGPIFTTLSLGSFLIWSYPQERVFVDGRLEVHSTEHFARYLAIRSGGTAWSGADREFGFNAAAIDYLEAPALILARLQDPQWAWVHMDGRAAVCLRRSEQNAPVIAEHELNAARLHQMYPALPEAGESALLPPRASWLARHVGPQHCPWEYLNPGQLLLWVGTTDLAAEQFRRAAFAAPTLASPRVLLATALSRLGRSEEAVQAIESIQGMPVSAADRPWVLATRADVLLTAGRPRDALVALDAYLAKPHGEAEVVAALLNRARAQLDLGNATAAAADCRRAISLRPNFLDAYVLLGGAEEARGNPGAALEAYRRFRAQGGAADEVTRAIERLESSHPDP